MTQEDKLLLLQDLCARLPFHPKCEMIDELRVVNNEKDSSYISTLFPKHIELFSYHNNFTIRPYLRPLSSMTEEEENEWCGLNIDPLFEAVEWRHTRIEDLMLRAKSQYEPLDWLNKHMFDYRGLIERGLALEASAGMYS